MLRSAIPRAVLVCRDMHAGNAQDKQEIETLDATGQHQLRHLPASATPHPDRQVLKLKCRETRYLFYLGDG